MKRFRTMMIVSAAIVSATPAYAHAAQQRGASAKHADLDATVPESNALSYAEFIKKAAQGNMAEIDIGQIAVERATNPSVKQFAQRIIDDHTKANTELMQLARKQGVSVPETMGEQHRHDMDRLSTLSGTEFDHAYMRLMLDEHQQDVALFRRQAQAGHDAELKAWIQKTLPVLEDHLRLAKEDAPKVGVNVAAGRTEPATPQENQQGHASR